MGVFSNEDIKREEFDREQPDTKKKIPDYSDDYKKFRQRYKDSSPRKPIEPKGWDNEPTDEQELKI